MQIGGTKGGNPVSLAPSSQQRLLPGCAKKKEEAGRILVLLKLQILNPKINAAKANRIELEQSKRRTLLLKATPCN